MSEKRIRMTLDLDVTLRHKWRGLSLELDIPANELGKLAVQYALREQPAFAVFAAARRQGRKATRRG